MSFNEVGGILGKVLSGRPQGHSPEYELCYFYNQSRPHQINQIHGQGEVKHFEYNGAGSVNGVYTIEGEEPDDPCSALQAPQPEGTSTKDYLEKMVWDEEQRLLGVQNDQGLHHYVYDSQGERIMKTSIFGSSIAINGIGGPGTANLDPHQVYVNPYYVAKQFVNWVDASKHYYMGSQRIATELIGQPQSLDSLFDQQPTQGNKTQTGSHYPITGALGAQSVWASMDTLIQRLGMRSNANFWDGLTADLLQYQEYYNEGSYNQMVDSCESYYEGQEEDECFCSSSLFYAEQIHELDCDSFRIIYWYHPDYLGHNEFITDKAGKAYQYFHYSAFGETLVQEDVTYGKFDAPWRFNGKELDQETGNYYYGARYYNPTWSVWLSVDPLLAKFPSMSPLSFVGSNPIAFVDPDGRALVIAGKKRERKAAYRQLKAELKKHGIKLEMNKEGLLSYTTNENFDIKRTEASIIDLLEVISNEKYDLQIEATNSFILSRDNNGNIKDAIAAGGAYFGALFDNSDGTVSGKQIVMPVLLGRADIENGTEGTLMLHEATELATAAVMAMERKEDIKRKEFNEIHGTWAYPQLYEIRTDVKPLDSYFDEYSEEYMEGGQLLIWEVNTPEGWKRIWSYNPTTEDEQ